MKKKPLTPRRGAVLDFILSTVRERGYFPTVREIGSAMGFSSPGSVTRHLEALAERGDLVRLEGRLAPAPRLLSSRGGIPLVGSVTAGRPVDAPENREGEVCLSGLFGEEKGLFAVRVRGDSMEGAGILEGDLVVVRPASRASPGETVLAYLGPEQESTVKIFRRGPSGEAVLEPRNPNYAALSIRHDPHFRIGGKVVGVVRQVRG
jgi:repressor LexA